MVRRTRVAALLTLAMINVFTLVAGLAVARMLPPRLAALKVATVASGPVVGGGAVLTGGTRGGALPTAGGLRSALAGPLSAAALGPQVSVMVADPSTGRVLLSEAAAGPPRPPPPPSWPPPPPPWPRSAPGPGSPPGWSAGPRRTASSWSAAVTRR